MLSKARFSEGVQPISLSCKAFLSASFGVFATYDFIFVTFCVHIALKMVFQGF